MSFIDRNMSRLGANFLDNDQLRSLAPSIFAEDKHESRSERYAYIPTIDLVDAMRSEGFFPVLAKQGKSRVAGKADFTKHLIRFRREGHAPRQEVGATFPEVALLNSHDGTSRYKLMGGTMRIACLNGMLTADTVYGEVSVSHSGNVKDKVIEGSFRVLAESVRAIDEAAQWGAIHLDRGEATILAEAVHEVRFPLEEGETVARTPITAQHLLQVRRQADQGRDLWTLSNVVQENAIRGGLSAYGRDASGARRLTTTREVRGIDADVKLNRAIWALTQKMAALKGIPIPA